jgi:hypothetical protein
MFWYRDTAIQCNWKSDLIYIRPFIEVISLLLFNPFFFIHMLCFFAFHIHFSNSVAELNASYIWRKYNNFSLLNVDEFQYLSKLVFCLILSVVTVCCSSEQSWPAQLLGCFLFLNILNWCICYVRTVGKYHLLAVM